jgi:electron-transferring-flavoprotein dehydrogenase
MSGDGVRPLDYPPPFRAADFIAKPGPPNDLRIDVGVCIVGAGPAGLAAAIRLGQRLGDDPETLERLGEVPIAVLEKGRAVGAHELSGAIVRPQVLGDLLPGTAIDDIPSFGPVHKESVYFLRRKRGIKLPRVPAPFRNHGNRIYSLSQLTRYLAERAEELGVMVLPETDAQVLLVKDDRVQGVRTGWKGLGRDGKERPGAAPPTEIVAQATVLAEGTQGHLRGVAEERFGLQGRFPQVYALGVKEIWRVPRALDRLIHTLGWPLRGAKMYGEFGGSFIYPMGADQLCIGMVVGLDYHDSSLSVHDLLQELKTHGRIRRLLEGGERIAWGAKTIPEGGYYALPSSFAMPGAVLTGDSAGMVNVPKLKGVHYALRSGLLAADAIYDALKAGVDPREPGALDAYDRAVRSSEIVRDLHRVRNQKQAFYSGLVVGSQKALLMDLTRGAYPRRPEEFDADARAEVRDLGRRFPAPDGQLTFDKLSSVFLSGNRTRDDQPNHIRVAGPRVPRELAETWVNMCPAAVYEIAEGSESPDGWVRLQLAPSNCVQCGAITAKGGRLTPPEGGSGPEYQEM